MYLGVYNLFCIYIAAHYPWLRTILVVRSPGCARFSPRSSSSIPQSRLGTSLGRAQSRLRIEELKGADRGRTQAGYRPLGSYGGRVCGALLVFLLVGLSARVGAGRDASCCGCIAGPRGELVAGSEYSLRNS